MADGIGLQTIKNVRILNKIEKRFVEEHEGQWIAFHNWTAIFCDTYEKALAAGYKKFGNVGFVIRKIMVDVAER